MKSTGKLIIFVLTFLALPVSAYAQSPREQLQQMVEQLQKTPNDNPLREKIIKLGAEIKPPPVVPDEAIRYEGRAQFAFANAKSEGDYLAAAKEYEKAVTSAPWVQNYYSDLCKVYEKAGKFDDAKRHCGFYLLGLNDPTQITEVKRRIAGLEFGIEKAASASAEAEKAARLAAAKKSPAGNWKVFVDGSPQRAGGSSGDGGRWSFDFHYRFEMRGEEIVAYMVVDSDDPGIDKSWFRRNGGGWLGKGDEDLFGRFTVEGNVIRGRYLHKQNTALSGTFSESEIRWDWEIINSNGVHPQHQTLRKQD